MEELTIIGRSDPNTHETVIALLKKYTQPNQKILDVGCGTGAFLYKIRNFSQERYGCDFDTNQYQEPSNKKNIQQLNLDTEPLPYQNESFDVVLCLDVLEHLFSPYRLLHECLRIVKKDGCVIISTPNVHSYIQRLYFLLTGRLKGFWDQAHNRALGERHITPIFKQALEESLVDKAEIIEETFNRSNIPKLGIELKTKNLFLSETSIWVIKKN